MVRLLVLILALANLGFYAWTQGWIDDVVGVRARGDREPERLLRQVRPEIVVILPAGIASAPTATAAPLACLEAGPFNLAEVSGAEAVLRTATPPVPDSRWTRVTIDKPGSWLIYMGKYAGPQAMSKKEEELKRRNVPYEEINSPAALDPGLSLGHFDDRASAVKALSDFTRQGIHTARVVELTAPVSVQMLRVDQADAALAGQLGTLKADALGKGFAQCAPVAVN